MQIFGIILRLILALAHWSWREVAGTFWRVGAFMIGSPGARDSGETDDATGLWRREAFLERATEIRGRTPRGALFVVSIDRFPRFHDTFGHDVRAWCLRAVADTLTKHAYRGDVIGGLNGAEFAVYMPAAQPDQIAQFGNAMARVITADRGDPFAPIKSPIALSVSVGVALAREVKDMGVLLRQADEALYDAKFTRRAKMVVWTADVTLPERPTRQRRANRSFCSDVQNTVTV